MADVPKLRGISAACPVELLGVSVDGTDYLSHAPTLAFCQPYASLGKMVLYIHGVDIIKLVLAVYFAEESAMNGSQPVVPF
jgi:methyl coenzyme M reductase gamma subunit